MNYTLHLSSCVDTLYTCFGIIIPIIKLRVYTFWVLSPQQLRHSFKDFNKGHYIIMGVTGASICLRSLHSCITVL